jgi:hypothetical protein
MLSAMLSTRAALALNSFLHFLFFMLSAMLSTREAHACNSFSFYQHTSNMEEERVASMCFSEILETRSLSL